VEILVDRTSIEAFVNRGEVSTSRCFLPGESGLSVNADGGQVAIHSLTVCPLKSAWKDEVFRVTVFQTTLIFFLVRSAIFEVAVPAIPDHGAIHVWH
jgi:hypothetical protein